MEPTAENNGSKGGRSSPLCLARRTNERLLFVQSRRIRNGMWPLLCVVRLSIRNTKCRNISEFRYTGNQLQKDEKRTFNRIIFISFSGHIDFFRRPFRLRTSIECRYSGGNLVLNSMGDLQSNWSLFVLFYTSFTDSRKEINTFTVTKRIFFWLIVRKHLQQTPFQFCSKHTKLKGTIKNWDKQLHAYVY